MEPHPSRLAPGPTVPVPSLPAPRTAGTASAAPDLSDHAALSRVLPPLPAKTTPNRRFRNYRKALSIPLNRIGAFFTRDLNRQDKDRLLALVRRAHTWLGQRRIVDLTPHELTEFTGQMRRALVETAPGFPQLLAAATARAAGMRGAVSSLVVATSVEVPNSGVWVFCHTRGSEPVVVAEAFVPRSGSGNPPARPDLPDARRPRWLHGDGSILDNPPPLPDRPALMTSGLPAEALDEGVEVLVDQLRRAEIGYLTRAAVPFGSRRFTATSVPANEQRTLGYAIEHMEYRARRSHDDGDFDRVAIIRGEVMPPIGRVGDEDFLPSPALLGEYGRGMERLHLWGSVLGDSTPFGQAYGPSDFNAKQLEFVEKYLKVSRVTPPGAELRITAYIKSVEIDGREYPFLREVEYDLTIDGRTVPTVIVWLTSAGDVRVRYGE
ncbi:hypothetical protein WJ438_37670 [Streptomyces sp. GD-15H]|uniref:hypothetical protein n=1 Tax=Streptomyces sp. GD-15H TaxID=3129112 RepID=UPI003249DFFA